ncbi:MAG TPA: cyclic nucleotide-binding domain-containing protein [Thermoplasmata archaeon]|nr:cyclic nucleotide-binding domain-containing protein [Thermoplasmata archaeon]
MSGVPGGQPPRKVPLRLADHPFFQGLDPELTAEAGRLAVERRFATGEWLVRDGDPAASFYLVYHGKVALEVATAEKPHLTIQTVGPGEVLGWSWLVSPYLWRLDARALKPTQVLAIDGARFREALAAHPERGYQFLLRLLPILAQRLENTQIQLLDIHGL